MEELRRIPLSKLHESPDNPRKRFGDLSDITSTIGTQGIIQPIVARRREDGALEIVAGHRRARAAKLAGLKEVPVIVRDWSRQQALVAALIENTERESLSALETARGYERLIKEHGMTPEQAAEQVGVKRAQFFAVRSLLSLPSFTQTALEQGKLSTTSAVELARVRGTERVQRRALEDVLALGRNGEHAPTRAVRKLIQDRYLSVAKQGKSKAQREAAAAGLDVAMRKRAVAYGLKLVRERLERERQLSDADMRIAVMALLAVGDAAREVFVRRGLKTTHLSAIGATQLRSLLVEIPLALAPALLPDGSYTPETKAWMKAYGLTPSELEKTVEQVAEAEALFSASRPE